MSTKEGKSTVSDEFPSTDQQNGPIQGNASTTRKKLSNRQVSFGEPPASNEVSTDREQTQESIEETQFNNDHDHDHDHHDNETGQSDSATIELTTSQLWRLATSFAAFRTTRLSIDLFIITYVVAVGFSITEAGTAYLVFNTVDVITGLVNLLFPTACVGSAFRGAAFITLTTGSFLTGFFLIFLSSNFPIICAGAALAGIGQSLWFVNFQTILNKSIRPDKIPLLAQIKQGNECVGFLAPCVVLAITNSSDAENAVFILQRAATVLGIFAFFLFVLGADVVILCASRIKRDTGVEETKSDDDKDDNGSAPRHCGQVIMEVIKKCWEAPVFYRLLLNACVLCFITLVYGTLGLLTERIFLLDSTMLWIASLASSIGGVLSVVFSFLCAGGEGTSHDPKKKLRNVFISTLLFFAVFVPTMSLLLRNADDESIFPNLSYTANQRLSMSMLFMYGLVLGSILGVGVGYAYELWVTELAKFDAAMVSRLNATDSTIGSGSIGLIFQAHTAIIDAVDAAGYSSIPTVNILLVIGPSILLFAFGLFILVVLFPKDDEQPCAVTSPSRRSGSEWFSARSEMLKGSAFLSTRSELLTGSIFFSSRNIPIFDINKSMSNVAIALDEDIPVEAIAECNDEEANFPAS